MRTFLAVGFTTVLVLGLLLSGLSCTQTTSLAPTATPASTITPILQGQTIVVSSTADSGPGSLRQALLDAESGDTIIFDVSVFSPDAPVTIYVTNPLPPIMKGNIIIDASNAGVILDGSRMPGDEFASCLEVHSNSNTVRGLQIMNFSPGAGINISGGVQNNTIGGDRHIGAGPTGQGNLVCRGDIGIALGDNGTSFNTITGNIVGRDASGQSDWGNTGSGVWIFEGASHNVIGPNNVIAYNKVYGIEMRGPSTLGNTITQNSIHDNARGGIYMWEGTDPELSAPVIFDFDISEGLVSGNAPANSTIEVFSDSNDQGRTYEGNTVADSAGQFTLKKGASFVGPHLTATATDADSNTSGFSLATSGAGRVLILQRGNTLPKSLLRNEQSSQLLDNHLADFVNLKRFEESSAKGYVSRVTGFGYKWDFLGLDWLDYTTVLETGEYSKFEITPVQDLMITDLAENGIKIICCLVDYQPGGDSTLFNWANLEDYLVKDPDSEGRFRTEEEINHYLDYVRFVVHNLKDRVKYYQILNEPFNGVRGQYVRSEDYINLIKRVVPVVRSECPDAKIVVGSIFGLPNESGCYEYLLDILNSDVMPMIDCISFHPSPDLSPEYDPACYTGIPCPAIGEGYYQFYQEMIQEIKQIASSHGFKGEYLCEGPVFAEKPRPPQTHYYPDIIAAKYYARVIIMYLNNEIIVALPLGDEPLIPITVTTVRNLCNVMEGTSPVDLQAEIQSEATNIRSYSFSSLDGDKLLALWTDGVAVDDDLGIEATITLPNFSAKKATGIDVLNGFEQELVTSVEDGSLVIHSLLIRDYPLIIRLSD